MLKNAGHDECLSYSAYTHFDLAQHANFTFELTRGLHWRGSDVASTTAAIKGPLTNQIRLIYQLTNQMRLIYQLTNQMRLIYQLTNQMRLIYQINQSDAFDISD
jgi:hypothetical protein